jgi:hypothetical protein
VVAGACVLTQNNMSNWYICADKLSADGKTLDPNFGTAGTLAIADGNVGAQTMAVQANGEFVFGSVCPKSSNPCGLVARATSSGQADTCFGSQTTNPCTGTGIVTFTSPPCKGAINGVAVDDTRGLIYASGADEISTMCAGVQPTYAILVGTLDE